MRKVTVSAVQMSCIGENEVFTDILMNQSKKDALIDENIKKAEGFVRKAKEDGANIVLLPELFELPYFCQERNYEYYKLATETNNNKAVNRFREVAKELDIVIIVSFYEKEINTMYNTVAVIDADGELLGTYRKVHIPDDHFYQEKFYFTPGNLGFKVWNTKYAKIGVGICWDQWFPETARVMALMGAEILFYPTAIGKEPILECDSMPHWRRCMKGHSGSNVMPVVAANRVGIETVKPVVDNNNQQSSLSFYGSSFITNEVGEVIVSADRNSEMVISSTFELDRIEEFRNSWGVFRDRRPECYEKIDK